MPALLVLLLPVLLAVLAIPYGADSRRLSRGSDWPLAGRPRTL
jgi:hypothetical protein